MNIVFEHFPNLTDKQKQQFEQFETLFLEWNDKINLISRKDTDFFQTKHVLHSLAIAKQVQFEAKKNILDIGTGGGFPGIPLAIFFPEVQFTLCDSIAKKMMVVRDLVEELGLENVTIHHGRVEEIKGQKFDYIVSRAVAPTPKLMNWTKRLKTKEGDYYLLKGGDLGIEIAPLGNRVTKFPLKSWFKDEFFETKLLLKIRY